ncbi:hypothetical protein HPB52_010221 [Rhipicephalus sanguineus]|uniref:Uncharacterized protein n=1 Tax=Rhipicephalus sanguineus TaxID=34632 RepID=A0A9D4PID3_RHISA|nr:hypothetical protein HPB52_010221 [Rhipicephalus sanguineus]
MTEAETAGTHFAGRLGQLEPFDESASDLAYIIGPKTYGLLKSLTTPDLPSTKSFEVLKKALSDHLSPKPSVIGERAKFHRRCQKEGEGSFNWRRDKDQLLGRTTDPDREASDQEGSEFLVVQPSVDPVTSSAPTTSGPDA